MARSRKEKVQDAPAHLSRDPEEVRARLQDRMRTGRELFEKLASGKATSEEGWVDYKKWDDFNREFLKRAFTTEQLAEEYEQAIPSLWNRIIDVSEERGMIRLMDFLNERIRTIDSIVERLPLFEVERSDISKARTDQQGQSSTQVFIVHGHDHGMKEAVARFVSQLDLVPVILHEQPSQGRTLIEKVEDYSKVGFAVVLLAPDDVVTEAATPGTTETRARQNVVFEFGYFVARLTRKKVCALYKHGVKLPSDLDGLVYVPWDERGAWKQELAREMRAAELNVDLNKV